MHLEIGQPPVKKKSSLSVNVCFSLLKEFRSSRTRISKNDSFLNSLRYFKLLVKTVRLGVKISQFWDKLMLPKFTIPLDKNTKTGELNQAING